MAWHEYPDPAVPGEDYLLDVRLIPDGAFPPPAWGYSVTSPYPAWGQSDRENPITGTLESGYVFFHGTVPAGGTTDYAVTISGDGGQFSLDIPGLAPVPVIPVTPPAPTLDQSTGVLTIPEADGVSYWGDTLDPLPAGPLQLDGGVTLDVHAEALEGYELEGVTSWSYTWTDPSAPDPNAYEAWVEDTGSRVERMMGGRATPQRAEAARDAVGIVAAFVSGYTGGWTGRGWTVDGVPDPRLSAVIVAASVRLAANPRQVTMYTTSDYSERPAVMAGWTLAERAVLRRYRRVSA